MCLHYFFVLKFLFLFFFSRTPGSRQPSPAEEQILRPSNLLDGQAQVGSAFQQQHHLHHMLGSAADHQAHHMSSYHALQMSQLQNQHLNGVSGMHHAQVCLFVWSFL